MKHTGLYILIIGFLLVSCNSKYPGFSKTDDGLYYKFHIENKDAQKPNVGDILTVMMTYRVKDSIMFSSADLPEAFRFPLDAPAFKGDIFEGLAMMHIGDSATFIVPADSLKIYGNLTPIDSGLMLYFDVKLISIQAKADFEKEQQKLKQQEKEAFDQMKETEKESIEKYVQEHNINAKPSASGLYFISKKAGKGAKAIAGKVVEIQYSAEFLDGKKLFSSRDDDGEPICFELGLGFEIPAIEEALQIMNAGSKARLIVPFELAYGQKGMKDLVPPYSTLVFDLDLISIMEPDVYKSRMEQKEKDDISKYLKQNNITQAPDEYGLYYIELQKGNGSAPTKGKTIQVNYTGKFLNGKTFDSSSEDGGPVEFVMGSDEAIKGWEIGLLHMKAGGRAQLIVPSRLAFGDTYNGSIPPYTPLVYELELLNVK